MRLAHPFRLLPALLAAVLLLSGRPSASAEEPAAMLPNGGFEESAPTSGNATLVPVDADGVKVALRLPMSWNAYQWGANGKHYAITVEPGEGRSGAAVRARNVDVGAAAGVYTHVALKPGIYRLTVWARAAAGQAGLARIYAGNRYSRPFALTDQWRQIGVTVDVAEAMTRAEINVQNCSGKIDDVWFDDAELSFVRPYASMLVPDTRAQRPRTLLFSPINVNYLRQTAPQWAQRGFRGFLFDGVMHDTTSDVWAVDKNPDSKGDDDALLREVRACNDACRAVDIDSNFIKVAFHTELPDPFDDAAWARLSRNFAEAADFARQSGCAGMAIDTEYVAHQYNPALPYYVERGYKPADLAAKFQERFLTITKAMLERYPAMVLLTLPEGVMHYKALYNSIFEGMLRACAQADAPGGLHLLTEETYHTTSPLSLASFAEDVRTATLERVDPALHDYWKRRCTVALGAWPLGYYRDIFDAKGKRIGYGGRKEVYGDKIIGSYADKSAWYSPAEFARQMAGLNTFSPRYNWIYAHGATFWSFTPEEAQRYTAGAHKAMGNATQPAVDNLAEYFDVIAKPQLVKPD